MLSGSNHRALVSVSELNQFLYCPRRYWYYRFYDAGNRSPDLVEGAALHDGQSRKSGQYREQYFASPSLGLHGKVDLVETDDEDVFVPVERKRASGGRYYWNDEVQVAGYCLLVHAATDLDTVPDGYIYLYSTDERHRITVTEDHRDAVEEVMGAIRSLSADEPPELVSNPNKCRSCSVRHECLPAVTSRVAPESVTDSEWSEVHPHE